MKTNSIPESIKSEAKEKINTDNIKKTSYPKVDGARRILYKGEERYIMNFKHAMNVFPNTFDSNEAPENSLVIIMGGNKINYCICASSDYITEPDFTIEATFLENEGLSDEREISKPYCLPLILSAIADMVLIDNYSIFDGDSDIFFQYVRVTVTNRIILIHISSAATKYFLKKIVLKILESGISDYAEAKDDYYHETRYFSKWGEGEEGAGVLNGQQKLNEATPIAVNIIHNDKGILSKALSCPFLLEIPYIKLISENGEIPV